MSGYNVTPTAFACERSSARTRSSISYTLPIGANSSNFKIVVPANGLLGRHGLFQSSRIKRHRPLLHSSIFACSDYCCFLFLRHGRVVALVGLSFLGSSNSQSFMSKDVISRLWSSHGGVLRRPYHEIENLVCFARTIRF